MLVVRKTGLKNKNFTTISLAFLYEYCSIEGVRIVGKTICLYQSCDRKSNIRENHGESSQPTKNPLVQQKCYIL